VEEKIPLRREQKESSAGFNQSAPRVFKEDEMGAKFILDGLEKTIRKIPHEEKIRKYGYSIVVANSVSNAGKSFITREMFYSTHSDIRRYGESEYKKIFKSSTIENLREIGEEFDLFIEKEMLISEVDSLNSGSSSFFKNDRNIHYEKRQELDIRHFLDKAFAPENKIFDIGSSSIRPFLDFVENYDSSFDVIDIVLVPFVPTPKALSDTNRFVKNLIERWGKLNKRSTELIKSKIVLVVNTTENYPLVKQKIKINSLMKEYPLVKELFEKNNSLFLPYYDHYLNLELKSLLTADIDFTISFDKALRKIKEEKRISLNEAKDNPNVSISEVIKKYKKAEDLLLDVYRASDRTRSTREKFLEVIMEILYEINNSKSKQTKEGV
jgi:hypothetical protein